MKASTFERVYNFPNINDNASFNNSTGLQIPMKVKSRDNSKEESSVERVLANKIQPGPERMVVTGASYQ